MIACRRFYVVTILNACAALPLLLLLPPGANRPCTAGYGQPIEFATGCAVFELPDFEIEFEYKRTTEAADRQPLDFYRPPNAPVALLE